MKPKDRKFCPHTEKVIEGAIFVGYRCNSKNHPHDYEGPIDEACTMSEYKDCDYREVK